MKTNVCNVKSVAKLATALAIAGLIVIGVVMGGSPSVTSAATIDESQAPVPNEPAFDAGSRARIDRSGKPQVGKASIYAERYGGRKMADGTPMQLYSNNAASLTLPLGTTAKVTNLETGKTAVVTIRDRGPYVKGRIVDLSPTTAKLLGISKKQGLAQVEVTPVSIPAMRTDRRMAALNPTRN